MSVAQVRGMCERGGEDWEGMKQDEGELLRGVMRSKQFRDKLG